MSEPSSPPETPAALRACADMNQWPITHESHDKFDLQSDDVVIAGFAVLEFRLCFTRLLSPSLGLG